MAAVGSRTGQVTVRVGENPRIEEESQPEDGKVENVKDHYNKNRQNRRTVREDIPVARQVFTQEESKAQYERMKQLEEQRRIAERDAEMARELQSQNADAQREEARRKQLHDEAVSRHIRQLRQHPQYGRENVVQEGLQGRPQEFARHMQERERRFAHNQNLLVSHNPQHAPQHALQHAPQHAQYGAAGDPGRPGSSIPAAVGNAGNYADMDRRGHRQEDVMADDYQQLSEAVGGPTLASLHTQRISDEPQSPNSDDFDEEALEAEDRELAMKLQREEEERYERKKQQRALAKERKRLERLIHQSQIQERGDTHPIPGRHVEEPEDDGDFSDFYIPPNPNMPPEQRIRLQEEQDAELARLMQDQEKRRPHSDVLRDKLRQIETQDSELARIIQEEENLRAKRRNLKHQQKLLQQQRELAERLASQQGTGRSQQGTGRSMGSSAGGASYSGSAPRPAHRTDSYQSNQSSTVSNERLNNQPREVNSSDGSLQMYPPSSRVADPHQSASSIERDRFGNPGAAGFSAPDNSLPDRDNQPTIPPKQTPSLPPGSSINGPGLPRLPRTNIAPPPQSAGRQANIAPPPQSSGRQAKLPISLPGRMMQNTDIDMRQQGRAGLVITSDIPSRVEGHAGPETTPPPPRRDMYAERPAGRGGYSPNPDRDSSPPGPALPERRYREDLDPNPVNSRHPLEIDTTSPARFPEHSRQGGPGDRYRPPTNRPHTEHSTQHLGGGGGGHRQGMPPYREPNPPPYITNLARPDPMIEIPPSSPRSAETHYDAPWDMSQLESQLLRDSMNQSSQSIVPRQVSPPGRRGEPPGQHRSPPVTGPNGRPLIEQNEDGQIVMNIAEMLDPTYPRRQGQRSSIAERPPSQVYDVSAQQQTVPSDTEITAVAGQRRSGRNGRQSGKRESCKQQ